ncbi:MAG: thiol-disulfide isomerase/thioredoxin [Flavobacteriales bacterium]|jgi:thiol-disulfide isomerase/thioredoxin
MKKILIPFAASLVLLGACNSVKPPPLTVDQIEKKAMDLYRGQAGISYSLTTASKYFTDSDTTFYDKDISWVRNHSDSILGAYVSIKYIASESMTLYSDYTNNGVNLKENTYKIYDYGLRKEMFDHKAGSALFQLLRGESIFEEIKADSSASIISYDTIIDNSSYWLVQTNDTGNFMFKEVERKYYFGKNDFRLTKVETWSNMMSSFNYDLREFKNQSFELDSGIYRGKYDQILNQARLDTAKTDYQVRKDNMEKNQTKVIPDLVMYTTKDSIEVNLKDLKGSVVLLDFWYMGCGWCYKGLPHLKEIYEKHKEDIILIGVNPFDGDDDYLNGFMADAGMTWPTYLITRDQAMDVFGLTGYPTYIVYDTEGNEAYKQSGYSDRFVSIIDSVLTPLIK